MCGIVGLIDAVAGNVPPALLEIMRDALMRRGPDGAGQYVYETIGMTMRRLAVIDLPGGDQPFFSCDRQVVAFQNGEIYNHRELRRELESHGYRFTSHCDTEVLAHGFVEWGIEGLLTRLDGMFALAILDKRNRELHLARDRFGEKPLFYASSGGRFAYSSSLQVLAALSWVSAEISVDSLNQYLALHYVSGQATIFKAIRRVLPGEHLVVPIDDPIPQAHRYYVPPLGIRQSLSDVRLMELIQEAVESRLISDVPVGIFLSGGLDSSLVAAIAAKKQPHISTFSMGFSSARHDESAYAKAVAEAVGSSHYHFNFDENSFRELLPKVASGLDEPVGDQALLPLYWLCHEARQHVTVALSGEGADEIFGGYSYYRSRALEESRRSWFKSLRGRASSDYNNWQRLILNSQPETPSGFPLLTDANERQRLTGIGITAADKWEENLFAWLNQSCNSLQRASATDLATWLPDDLLVKFDRMSMAHSLEGRAPYLHPKIVEAGLALPPTDKVDGATSKVALRRVAARWLPPQILNRPKQGFVLPMAAWLSQWFKSKQSVRDYFLSRAVPGLNVSELAILVERDVLVGVSRERLLFALLLLVEWHQSFERGRGELARKYNEAIGSKIENSSI